MSGENGFFEQDKQMQEKRKRMSCAIQTECPGSIQEALNEASEEGYHFIVTYIIHPKYVRDTENKNQPQAISRTDRILTGSEWNRLIVGMLTPTINVDSEIPFIRESNTRLLRQELGFAGHLGLPAIMITLTQPVNANLARILYNTMLAGIGYQIWIKIPMVHPSRYSPLCDESEREDSWEWWNNLRRYCHYDKRLGLVLEMPYKNHVPSQNELNRWIGEPVKALSVATSLFLMNQHGQPVLSQAHQTIIRQFLSLDVQYIINGAKLHGHTYRQYCAYMSFLGKKLYTHDLLTEFVHGCEDLLQNPLQPLTEHLETNIYEVFEKDQVKYVEYQNAIKRALEDLPSTINVPVVMVVGAGRGPLVQAALNASYMLRRKIKVYAVEKNPYAINTLVDRVTNEWHDQVILVHQDMRVYEPPEKADILVSELLGM